MHRVMIHPATYEDCRKAVDRAFVLFPQSIAGKKVVKEICPEKAMTLR